MNLPAIVLVAWALHPRGARAQAVSHGVAGDPGSVRVRRAGVVVARLRGEHSVSATPARLTQFNVPVGATSFQEDLIVPRYSQNL